MVQPTAALQRELAMLELFQLKRRHGSIRVYIKPVTGTVMPVEIFIPQGYSEIHFEEPSHVRSAIDKGRMHLHMSPIPHKHMIPSPLRIWRRTTWSTRDILRRTRKILQSSAMQAAMHPGASG
jgi:hypothetical protein